MRLITGPNLHISPPVRAGRERHRADRLDDPRGAGRGRGRVSAAAAAQPFRIGVDTGGTFTDLVAVDERDGSERKVKVPSTPRDPAAAVLEGVRPPAASPWTRSGSSSSARRSPPTACCSAAGQRTVYLTTAGPRGRAVHPAHRPQGPAQPAVGQADAVRAAPRLLRRRRARPLRRHGAAAALPTADVAARRRRSSRAARRGDGRAASASRSTCSSPTSTPRHEQRAGRGRAARAARRPGLRSSSEVAPIWREYERGNTVIVDAYLRRLIGEFAGQPAGRARGPRDALAGASS